MRRGNNAGRKKVKGDRTGKMIIITMIIIVMCFQKENRTYPDIQLWLFISLNITNS